MPGKRMNILGKQFNRLTVIAEAGTNAKGAALWLCRCDCGGEAVVSTNFLTSGRRTRCMGKGCGKLEVPKQDLTGRKFHELTVVEFAEWRQAGPRTRIPYWHVLCSCGARKQVSGNVLLAGDAKSCGHLVAELASARFRKPFGVAALNSIIKQYKWNAKSRGLCWELSDDAAKSLFAQHCWYCGKAPAINKFRNSNHVSGCPPVNGIDRKDNALGYIPDNVVACCTACNKSKADTPYDVFVAKSGVKADSA